MDMMVPQNNDCDYKICNTSLSNQLCDFVLMDVPTARNEVDTTNSVKSKTKESNKMSLSSIDYEKMLYFVCNLCPYLCIKDSKITEHLEAVHKDNKTALKPLQLKCPACPNIFYRNMSLKSHLVHDHKVAHTDLRQIVQAVVYYAKKSCNSLTKSNENKNDEPIVRETSCDNEIDANLIEKLLHSEKVINNEHSYSKEPDVVNPSMYENIVDKSHDVRDSRQKDVEAIKKIEVTNISVMCAPTAPVLENNIENTSNTQITIQKKADVCSKFLNLKMMQKCSVVQCKVRMGSSEKLNYHMQCHVDTTFKCLECDEMFAFWKPLTAHLWRVHNIDMELYSCDKCSYKSPSLGKLNNSHKLIHSDIRAYECETCNKKFKNLKQLRNHRMIHKEKVKKFVHTCETCSKAFSDKRQLNVHKDVVHKKIKPFLCSYCGYKGASKSTLKMHIRQHTGEKPFSCDSCEYSTSDHNSLRRHKLRHTGQKPYKCSHCKYACIQTSTYKEHIRTKHPGVEKDLVFTCRECQFRSVNQEMYFSHLFLVHQQKP